jgi:lysophospholipase L1-like esterase
MTTKMKKYLLLIMAAGLIVNAADAGTKWLKVGEDKNLKVYGLPWFAENNGLFYRLPVREQENITETAWWMSKCPSGARVRFKTDSTSLKLKINHGMEESSRIAMWHMGAAAVSGIDLYLGPPQDNLFWMTTIPKDGSNEYEHTYFTSKSRQMREFTLYLSVYAELASLKVGVDSDAAVEGPTEYRIQKPIVVYGTSITQGACASRGSNSFTAIVGRRLNADIVNLGFSGSGCGEEIMAKLITEIDASVYIVDSVANMNAEFMEQRYEKFVTVLREARPEIPVILMTKIRYAGEFEPERKAVYDRQHKPLFETYEKFVKQGDKNVYLFDAGEIIKPGGDHPTVDGTHMTDTGFHIIADELTPFTRDVLSKLN